ncbi:hypothetical protein CFE70_000262 [Pyrenophora teres f. teres 0-1]
MLLPIATHAQENFRCKHTRRRVENKKVSKSLKDSIIRLKEGVLYYIRRLEVLIKSPSIGLLLPLTTLLPYSYSSDYLSSSLIAT